MKPLSNLVFVRRLLNLRRDVTKKKTDKCNIYIGLDIKI